MYGIKIGMTSRAWPGDYHRLDVLLRPIAEQLRSLWWATEKAVYTFPVEWINEPGDGTFLSGPSARAFDASFVSGAARPVARPGFLPTYARVVSGDWSAIYGFAENPARDAELLESLGDLGFFAGPEAFPPTALVVIRGIDWAYWEVFAREIAVIDAVHDHLSGVDGLTLARAS